MRRAWILALLASACAKELPIRYEVCDGHGRDCDLVARFRDLKSCEFHLRYATALCDSASSPGYASCDFTQSSTFSSGRCTK